MNQADFLIIVLLVAGGYFGHWRGLVRSGGDLVSLLFGLVLTALVYPAGVWFMRLMVGRGPVSDVLGFALTAVGIVFGTNWLISCLAERLQVHPRWDRWGGAGAGVLNAMVLIAAFLPVLSAAPNAGNTLNSSRLAGPFMAGVPWAMEAADRLGTPMPKMVMLPTRFELEGTPQMRHGLQLLRINFSRLDGSMCIKCRGRMRFLGYKRRFPPAISPKFQCEQCGRTTDGCQSFQGMHQLYNECPVNVAKRGVLLNCGVWTNPDSVLPKGKCPVCGRELHPEDIKPRPQSDLVPWQ